MRSGRLLPPPRCRGCPVSGMEALSRSEARVLAWRYLGSHARTRHSTARPLLPDDRVRIPKPRGNLQIKFTRQLSTANEFVAFIDAIGQLDGRRSVIEWKTTASRYPEEPDGLLA